MMFPGTDFELNRGDQFIELCNPDCDDLKNDSYCVKCKKYIVIEFLGYDTEYEEFAFKLIDGNFNCTQYEYLRPKNRHYFPHSFFEGIQDGEIIPI